MSEKQNDQPKSDEPTTTEAPAPEQPKRKPYEKPAIVSEECFETLALACGKFNGSKLACNFSSRS